MIHDNLIPKYYLKELQNYFLSGNCDWYFGSNLTYGTDDGDLGGIGFSLDLYKEGHYVQNFPGTLCRSLVTSAQELVEEFVGCEVEPIRARADMTLYNPDNYRHSIHTDFSCSHTTAIFYVNNSDGNTLLFDGDKVIKEVEPVENRLFVFNGLVPHTGHSPSKHKNRVLINMNFVKS